MQQYLEPQSAGLQTNVSANLIKKKKKKKRNCQNNQNILYWNRFCVMCLHKCKFKFFEKKYQEKLEIAYILDS